MSPKIIETKFLKGFFDFHRERVKKATGSGLTQQMVASLEPAVLFLLRAMRDDPSLIDIRHASYMFATVYHETAATMRPISEYGKGKGRSYGKPVTVNVDGVNYTNVFYGRGYVQLTWLANYERAARELNAPRLLIDPELANDPQLAYAILARGMRNGWFTGKKLSDYIGPRKYGYVNARRIVNGTDRASLIASYADRFELIFTQSVN